MRYLIAICFTLFCCCSALFAQVPAGQIVGAALDAAGAAMPGVRVVVTNDATGQQYKTTTGAEGDYLVRALPPGRYRIAAEHDGYSKFLRESVAVSSLQNVRVDLTLQVGAVTDTVTVTGSAPLIETRTATTGVLIDDKRITDLPQNGRNVLGFVALTPGVVRVALENSIGGFSQQQVNINGNRSSSTNYQLDGASHFAPFRGGGLRLPPPDAVQEFRVVASGMTAEYGRGTAVISAVTKSGTNELHGTLYNYLRNDALDAKGFFDASNAKLRYNRFIISERQKLGFRAELFNAANHANLTNPNGTLTSISFGRITGTQGGPRNVQFALRYEF